MKIFKGKEEAEKILFCLKKNILKEKIEPKLAIILVGKDKPSELYIKLKKKAAQRVGIKIRVYKFKETSVEKEIIQKIKDLNKDSLTNGIIVQLPLPKKLNKNKIIKEISPEKDVDGFREASHFLPVLPSAIFIALRKGVKNFKGKKVLSLTNSDFFGKKLQLFLKDKNIKSDYVLIKKISAVYLAEKMKSADIIITVCGRPNLIKAGMVKEGVVLIDAGISWLSEKKVIGDTDIESIKEKVSFLTPPTGGLGPLTVALLLRNTYLAVKINFNKLHMA